MSVKEVLKKNVPEKFQFTPEFSVFVKWVAQKKIQKSTQLKHVLNAEIKELQDSLNRNMSGSREGTNTRINRQRAKQLDFLKLCRDKICRYL
jgi:hypothetical protein